MSDLSVDQILLPRELMVRLDSELDACSSLLASVPIYKPWLLLLILPLRERASAEFLPLVLLRTGQKICAAAIWI